MENLGEVIKKMINAIIKMIATFIRIGSDMVRGIIEIIGSMFATLFSALSAMLEGINKNLDKKKQP